MKLATFRQGGGASIGAVDTGKNTILDLQGCHRALNGREDASLASMLALIDAGPRGIDLVRGLLGHRDADDPLFNIALDEKTLLAPLPEPRQIRDFSVFAQHLRDGGAGLARTPARASGKEPPPLDPQRSFPQIYADAPIFYFSNRFNVSGPGADIPWPRDCKFLDFELEFGICIGRDAKNVKPETRARLHLRLHDLQ